MPDLTHSLLMIDYQHLYSHLDYPLASLSDTLLNHVHLPIDLLAQARPRGEFNQDVLGDIGRGWNTFVESGQMIAVIIGFVLGYLLRSITAG